MAQVYQNIGSVVLMVLLLAGSAFFSGSETALFNLSRRQVEQLRKSRHRLQNLTASLLAEPSRLLSCLLFGNMTVNVLFFAITSVLTVKVSQQLGVTAAVITAFISFTLLVLLGEILPKSLAYINSTSLSVATTLPLVVLMKVFAPLQFVLRFLIIEPVLRLLLGRPEHPKPITTMEFKLLIDQVRRRGLITADENKLLGEIVELGFLKVRHCLQPRVDMIACAVTDSVEKARKVMMKNDLTKLPVYVRKKDNIIGLVYLRQIMLQPQEPLERLVRQVNFVPEQKTVESLLEFFRQTHTDIAIVVDEYGGIAGSICLEDIAEELLGPMESTDRTEPIEQLGPFEYRLAGDLSIHDWADVFGIEPSEMSISTVAGLVTALLGKIPKAGDVAHLKNLKFTVEQVRKHRIKTLILTLEPIPTNDK